MCRAILYACTIAGLPGFYLLKVSINKVAIHVKRIVMKNIFSLIFVSILLIQTSKTIAQIDRSIVPAGGPIPELRMPDSDMFLLENGLTIILVENSQLPMVTFTLYIDADPVLQKDSKGYVDLLGGLLREGTENLTKEEIDKALDFMGVRLTVLPNSLSGSVMSRYREDFLEILADMAINPVFPEEGISRSVTQLQSTLSFVATNSQLMAQNIASSQMFGQDHPYGEVLTHKTAANISRDLLVELHRKRFIPNAAYLVIVGDINKQDARKLSEKYFGSWKQGEKQRIHYPMPELSSGNKVLFGNRPGVTQSHISITYPVSLTPGHENEIPATVMNNIFGGGLFAGRLLQNLREDKGFTYGAYSQLQSDRVAGRLATQVDVRNSVTVETIGEKLREMDRLRTEYVKEEELVLIQNFMSGQFIRSLQNPENIARFALNIQKYNLPDDYYQNYLNNLTRVTPEDVKKMALQYLKPGNSYIVVVGDKEEVAEDLRVFATSGEVEFFDAFGRPVAESAVQPAPDHITLQDVLDKYIESIGGRRALEKMENVVQVSTVNMQGMELTITGYQNSQGMVRIETAMGNNVVSLQVFDGSKFTLKSPMGEQTFTEGAEFNEIKRASMLNPELDYSAFGVDAKLLGWTNVLDKDAWKVELIYPDGYTAFEYYCKESGRKIRRETPTRFTNYLDYQPIVMQFEVPAISFWSRLFGSRTTTEDVPVFLPCLIQQDISGQVMDVRVTEIRVNEQLDEPLFKNQ